MNGVPKMAVMRSISLYGLSDVIMTFDEGTDVLVEKCTFIHADVVGVLLVDDRLIHEHGGERQVRGIDKGADFPLESGAREEKAGQDAGGLCLHERADNGLDGGVERDEIATRHFERVLHCAEN